MSERLIRVNKQKPKRYWHRNEKGAIDLASIMVGVIVIGLIGGVIAAAVFTVIPWAQDNAAKQQLDSIVVAQAAYKAKTSDPAVAMQEGFTPNSYGDSSNLNTMGLLSESDTYCMLPEFEGQGYVAYALSASGKVFTVSDKNTKPKEHSVTSDNANLPGCGFLSDIIPADTNPTETHMTFKCDATTTGFLPVLGVNNGTLKIEGSDGTNVEKSYTSGRLSDRIKMDAGVEYKIILTGKYTGLSTSGGFGFTLAPCYLSLDHLGSETGVTEASSAFYGATNLTSVPARIPKTITTFRYAFYNTDSFNHPNISKWDTSNVTNMSNMFDSADIFNQPLNNWDTSSVTNMSNMFDNTKTFNQPLNNWDTSNVTNMSNMFAKSKYDTSLNGWDVSNVTDMTRMFYSSPYNKSLDEWNPSKVETMEYMFAVTPFNQSINSWNVSNVTNMSGMFSSSSFNQPLDKWDVSNVTNMSGMFWVNEKFNQPIDMWNLSSAKNLSLMFSRTTFNQPLNNWDVSNVTNMRGMFSPSSFNQPLDKWDVSNVTNMSEIFYTAKEFNQPLNNWDVSNVTNMEFMFATASKFNQPLNNWDVSNVTNMRGMFQSANKFEQQLDKWNVSKVTDVSYMFNGAGNWRYAYEVRDTSSWRFNVIPAHNTFAPGAKQELLPPQLRSS